MSQSLSAFQADLEARGLADRVLVHVWSEFGRRARAERRRHRPRRGWVSMLIGTHAAGGMVGEFPGLSEGELDHHGNIMHSRTSAPSTRRCARTGSTVDPAGIVPDPAQFYSLPLIRLIRCDGHRRPGAAGRAAGRRAGQAPRSTHRKTLQVSKGPGPLETRWRGGAAPMAPSAWRAPRGFTVAAAPTPAPTPAAPDATPTPTADPRAVPRRRRTRCPSAPPSSSSRCPRAPSTPATCASSSTTRAPRIPTSCRRRHRRVFDFGELGPGAVKRLTLRSNPAPTNSLPAPGP